VAGRKISRVLPELNANAQAALRASLELDGGFVKLGNFADNGQAESAAIAG
jgi:hypothetical protein